MADDNLNTRKTGGMTVQEAGRKGGSKVRDERGPAFYKQIGQKGGRIVSQKYGPEFYEKIGRIGGQRVKELIEQGKRAAGRRQTERDENA